MSEIKKPETKQAFLDNFGQIKPLMNATMAYYESSRCLFCYDAPCIKACPTDIDIPLFIRQINADNVVGAAQTIYASNYFGNTCGKVCPTEVLCEGACVYNHQDVAPIDIGRLQNFATHHAMTHDIQIGTKGESNGMRVAVVGGGPAGISCACELSRLGYEVTVFEANDRSGGLALYGTAPYKILNEEVIDEVAFLQKQFGFNIQTSTKVDKQAFQKLENDYDAIFLGVGLGKTRTLGMEGEDMSDCLGAVEFIHDLKSDPLQTTVGKRVVVIGGGNTAMDAASECARMGASEVTLIYRRSSSDMSAYEFELDLAKSVGVRALFNVSQVELVGFGDQIKRIKCMKTTSKDGKLNVIDHSEFYIDCDMVIKATGQAKRTSVFGDLGLQVDSKGRLEVSTSYQCSNQKYFAAGDAVNGGAEVVNACGDAKQAALGIHSFLNPTKG